MSNLMYIHDNPDGTRALHANTALPQGTLITEEVVFSVPTSVLPNASLSKTWRDVMLDMRNLEAHHVDNALEELATTPAGKKKAEAFRATFTEASSDLQRFQIISYDVCPRFNGKPIAFVATAFGPYLNHQCVQANLQFSWDEGEGRIHLRALTDVGMGDELSISYCLDDGWMGREERMKELDVLYSFECVCRLCGDREKAKESDVRRERIRELQSRLKNFSRSGTEETDGQAVVESARQYVELVEEEIGGVDPKTGLPFFADVRLATAYHLASVTHQKSGDAAKADALKNQAVKIRQICFGPDSKHVKQADELFDDWLSAQ